MTGRKLIGVSDECQHNVGLMLAVSGEATVLLWQLREG